MKAFVAKQTAKLVGKVGAEIRKTDQAADAIHDLRVATRRLTECLRIFRQFYPHGAASKVRKQLKQHMDLAAYIRNRDIAIELLRREKVSAVSKLIATLSEERNAAQRELTALLARRSRRRVHKHWRRQLELDA